MGLVARQSFKAGIVTYLATLIGVLNILFIFPLTLTISQLGEIQLVLTFATTLGTIILFGGPLVLTNFYPKLKENKVKTSALLGLLILIPVFVMAIVMLSSIFLHDYAITYFSKAQGNIAEVAFWSTLILSLLTAHFTLFVSISALFGRIAVPSVFTNLIKLYLPLLSFALFYQVITYVQLFQLLVLFYIIILVLIGIYTYKIGDFEIRFNLKTLINELPLKSIFTYSGINILAGIAYSLANQVDMLMLASMMNTYATGLYVWSLFIANAIIIPLGLISNVVGPIIAENWSKSNTAEIQKVYTQSASTLLTLGVTLFAVFFLSIDDLFAIMPKGQEFQKAKWLVFLLGISKLIDMSFGINHIILTYSAQYKLNMYFIVLSAGVNIVLNFLLIPIYGLIGCGIATLVSLILFNVCKWGYLFLRYKLNPFNQNFFKNLGIGALLFLILYMVPRFNYWLFNILIFSGGYFLFYLSIVHYLKLAPELSNFISKFSFKR